MEFKPNKPIFVTIKEYYAHLIDKGTLEEGQEMPSVREIALLNGVNPNTVQRALSLLCEEGYLVSIPKKGFFVNKRKDTDSPLKQEIKKLLDDGYTKEQIVVTLEEIQQERGKK